jgi:hypothetical protein
MPSPFGTLSDPSEISRVAPVAGSMRNRLPVLLCTAIRILPFAVASSPVEVEARLQREVAGEQDRLRITERAP